MNEIEKTIMYWEEFKQEAIDMIAEGKYSNSVLEKQIPMCNTALDALREKAERSKGCEWCIDMDDFDRFEHYRIDREGNAEVHAHMVLANLSRFCPMCGRFLLEKKEGEQE